MQNPDLIAQAAITAVHLLGGHWITAALQACVLAYNANLWYTRKHLLDVTEVFRQVTPRRKALSVKLAFHVLLFVWTIYRFIEIMVLALITPTGRSAARTILREAAATLHRRR